MASPQLENGYTRISNELFEEIIKSNINGSEKSVVLFIIRKTYGFNKKDDRISLSQFQDGTKLSRPTVVKSLGNLLYKNIILKVNDRFFINKNYEKWGSKSVFTSKGVFTTTSKSGFTETSKSGFTYKRKKDNIQKKDIFYQSFKESEQTIIKTMYNYVLCDESGNPIKHTKIKKRISKEENNFLISIGILWQDMASKMLDIPKDDVVMKNIYYPIRECYMRDKFKKEDFKKLFEYFLKDTAIKYESKLAFDLCLSQKYVAKFKLSRKNQNISNSDVIKNIKL